MGTDEKRNKVAELVAIVLLWLVAAGLVASWMHSQSLREANLYPMRNHAKALVGVIK